MAAPSGGLIYSLLGCFSSVLPLNISFAHTSINQPMPDYVLGHTDLEQERLALFVYSRNPRPVFKISHFPETLPIFFLCKGVTNMSQRPECMPGVPCE